MQMQGESHVMTCLAEECSWNCREECCAPSVQIGDDHPKCDTYTTGAVSPLGDMAPVKGCLVTDCHFNHELGCDAAGITLSIHSAHADCMTYRQ